eukprot:1157732-Pelagomonas_calceolata.AAC.5
MSNGMSQGHAFPLLWQEYKTGPCYPKALSVICVHKGPHGQCSKGVLKIHSAVQLLHIVQAHAAL